MYIYLSHFRGSVVFTFLIIVVRTYLMLYVPICCAIFHLNRFVSSSRPDTYAEVSVNTAEHVDVS